MPHADVDCFAVPEEVRDENGAVPVGRGTYRLHGRRFLRHRRGDTVAVWGCGGVGLMAQLAARLLHGAERVIAIDRFPERLKLAQEKVGAETINYAEVDSVR